MKISKIQPTQINQTYNNSVKKLETPPTRPQPTDTMSFKGGGNGALIGLATGTAATVLAIGLVAITGGLALPGVLATGAIVGGAAAGAVAGDKIEDKINETNKSTDTKNFDING